MIVIESIKYFETDKDPWEIVKYTSPYEPIAVDDGNRYLDRTYYTECIRGRRFRRPDGEELIAKISEPSQKKINGKYELTVGISEQAAEILGLQYTAWEAMESALHILPKDLTRMENQLKADALKISKLLETLEDSQSNVNFLRKRLQLNSLKIMNFTCAGWWQRLKWLFTKYK